MALAGGLATSTSRARGVALLVAGAGMQGLGILVDVQQHADDPGLAAREGLFTLGNVGHALLVAGIAVSVVGALLAVLGPWLDRPRTGRGRAVRHGLPGGAAVAIALGVAVAANSSLARGHGHEVEHASASTASGVDDGTAAALGSGHSHGAPTGPRSALSQLDPALRATLGRELVDARRYATRFPTVAAAEAAGFKKITDYISTMGAHYARTDDVDGEFETGRPEMLLFDGTTPGSRVVGLTYYVISGEKPPRGFTGDGDQWHNHPGVCFVGDRFVHNLDTGMLPCVANGRYQWMLHAWVVPGYESGQGVFSTVNPDIP